MNSCDGSIETTYLGDVSIDNLTTLPDYFLTERDITDETTGNVLRTILRTPVNKILPNGNYDNITVLETNNPALDSLEADGEINWSTQVMAGYVANEVSTYVMYPSDTNHPPMFLMRGEMNNGTMLIQSTGFVSLLGGHQYVVGTQYYADATGKPTTDGTITGFKLFIPISSTKLVINMGQ